MHEEAGTIAAQMGRPLAGTSRVAVRCHLGLPLVIEAAPEGDAGAPFPTLWYLTCPLARRRLSRLEHAGWVRALTARLERDPAFAAAFAAANEAYTRARAARVPAGSPVATRLHPGVGGTAGAVKCLHAHWAHGVAGGPNPVADAIRDRVEPLDCTTPCVADGRWNPAWHEPPTPGGRPSPVGIGG